MEQLSAADYRGVLEVVYEAEAVQDSDPFPEPVLEALKRLVPCNVVSYGDLGPLGHADLRVRTRHTAHPDPPSWLGEVYRSYLPVDPLPPHGATLNGASAYSDLFSRRQFHGLDFYIDLVRPLGIEDVVRLWLRTASGVVGYFDFDFDSRGSHARDENVLDVLHPHLARFWSIAAARRLPAAGLDRADNDPALTRREREVLTWAARGKTNRQIADQLFVTEATVAKHLERTYSKLGVHSRTAAIAHLFALNPSWAQMGENGA
jgi:DNA-binding CsgD family transcriptional regulator